MSELEKYDQVDKFLKKLNLCTEESQIDNLFEEFAIYSFQERIELIDRCMNATTNHSSYDEDEYKFCREVFVEGSWRLLD